MAKKQTAKDKFREQVRKAQAKREAKEHYKKVRKESKKLMENLGGWEVPKGNSLNAKDSPYLKEKKQKVDKRRRPADILDEDTLATTEISSKMTAKEIKNFIKQAVREINKTVAEVDVDYRVQQSYDYIRNRFGSYRGKLTTLSKGRKDELLSYARNLKSHMAIDDYTSYGKNKIDKRTQKAFTTYIMHNPLRGDMDMKEFNTISKMFSKMSSELIEKYDSNNLIELWQAQRESDIQVTPQDFASIAMDVYDKKGKGANAEDLADMFRDELKKTFDTTFYDDDDEYEWY